MQTEKLTLKHKDLFYNRLKKINAPFSEFSFANLYLFREVHQYKVHIEKECELISGLSSDKKSFVLPLCLYEEDKPDLDYIKNLLKKHQMLFPVSNNQLNLFPENEFAISDCRHDSDYIFETEKIASYRGRKLHKKRNLLKQFLDNHTVTSQTIDKKNINDAIQILDIWQQPFAEKDLSSDFVPCKEALSLINELNLKGIIYYIKENPAGFILGEGITEDIFALHFAKGLTVYKGIYQYMYNDLANSIKAEYKYINFEQDLGLQSLRQAKSSYYPEIMAHKYRISLK